MAKSIRQFMISAGLRFLIIPAVMTALGVPPAYSAGEAVGQPAGKGPEAGRPGPWDNDVLVYSIDREGRMDKLAVFERAGVPTLARMRDGRLIAAFQYFPQDGGPLFDKVAVSFSSDEGRNWSIPEPAEVDGMDAGMQRPFDPTLVPLPDGRIRLYFTSHLRPRNDPKPVSPGIFSGVSNDGVHYQFEPGARFELGGRIVIDCAVALHDGKFHLIVPDNGTADKFMGAPQGPDALPAGTGYHAVSLDGLRFERLGDITMPMEGRWLGNMQSDGGRLAFFGTGPGPWPVVSTDGNAWAIDSKPCRLPGADPGAVRLRGGTWLVLVTGPPRPGTPSAARGPGRMPMPLPGHP